MKFAVMVKALYNKITEIKEYSTQKTMEDIQQLLPELPGLKKISKKLIQERAFHTIGLFFSILKFPKELSKYENTARSLLGQKHYLFKYANYCFSTMLPIVQSLASEGVSSNVWNLFEKYQP